MPIERTILSAVEVANIVGKSEIINSVRICTNRAAATIEWPEDDTDGLRVLIKTILNDPTAQEWLDAILYYVVNNNPQIDWYSYNLDRTNIEAEIYTACWLALYGVCGKTVPGQLTVTTTPTELTEGTLDGAVILLTLLYDFFKNDTLDVANFTLINAPDGLTVASVRYLCEDMAEITLAFDGTDFDDDCVRAHLKVKIAAAEVDQAVDHISPPIEITPLVESLEATANPTPLTEGNLNGNVITIVATNETFKAGIASGDVNLNNAPAGTTVGSVSRVDEHTLEVTISFDGTDFEVDVLDFSVKILGSGLTRGNDLTTQDLPITALTESVAFSLPDLSSLTEGNINGAVVRLTLTGEVFTSGGSFVTGNFALINAPAGVTIASVNRVSDTVGDLTLAFDGTDFDANVTDFAVQALGGAVTRGNALTTPDQTITALVESVFATPTNVTSLKEDNLNGAIVRLTLTNEEFISSVTPGHYSFNNAPPGVLIVASATRFSANKVDLLLAYIPSDFDANITDFSITIDGSELTRGNGLTSQDMTITAVLEAELVAVPTPDPLSEDTLNGSTIELTVSGDTFVGGTGLIASHFNIDNAPAGLVVGGVAEGSAANKVILTLGWGTGDFDAPQAVSITVAGDQLVGGVGVTSQTFIINAIIE